MSELTVASTTDAQNDINAAAGAPIEKEEVENAEAEQAEGAESEHPEQKDDSVKKDIAVKRLDRLRNENRELKARERQILERLEALEKTAKGDKPAEPRKEEKKAEPEAKARPSQEQYATWDEYAEALADWKFDQRMAKIQKESKEAEAQQAAQKAEREMIEGYNAAVTKAQELYEDFDEVVNRNIQIPEVIGQAIVEQKCPEVAYYLGKHPEVCKQLMAMTPITALTEMGRIRQLLEPVESEEPSSAPSPRIKTRAGEPIRPVASSSTRSTVSIDELPYQDYRKIRDRQEKDRYRR